MTISPAQIDAIDFFHDPALVADPYPLLARMREESPVLREPTQGVLVVTGYDEVLAVVGDHESFSSCTSVTGPFPGFPVSLEGLDEATVRALIDDGYARALDAEVPEALQPTVAEAIAACPERAIHLKEEACL